MKVVLLRFGELFLKGNNKCLFESALIKDIKYKLSNFEHKFVKTQGRYIISNIKNEDIDQIVDALQKVFGLHSLSVADEVSADPVEIEEFIKNIQICEKTFKVIVKRADKKFPISSMDFAKKLGGVILANNKNISVDVQNPDIEVFVDIRFNQKAYIFSKTIMCLGGLPNGTSGRGLLLLSGGIDSPVAGFMMGKRGMRFDALHFHSYPYTSEQAKDKVICLAEKLAKYTGSFKMHIVSFTKIQEKIHKKCSPEFMITIMRRIMMRIAERICQQNKNSAIITGESLGQVASQTVESMTVTNMVVEKIPVLRPCVALDKEEIIKISKSIDCFDTSILPFEDCCTVFLPKNPVIKPSIWKSEKEEGELDIDSLIDNAMENKEVLIIK